MKKLGWVVLIITLIANIAWIVMFYELSYGESMKIERPRIERPRIERERPMREHPRMERIERKDSIREELRKDIVDLEDEEEKASWIEIELKDEEGVPVPSGSYEITSPDGETVDEGSLDSSGQAHISVPESGSGEINFPDLDAEAWERAE